jgi:hypothetical protein
MSSVFICPHCGAPHTVPPGGPPPGASCTQCGKPLTTAGITAGAPPPTVVPVEEAPALVTPARRRREDDEWEEAPPRGEALRIPGSVRAAGIIWTVFGTLILLNFAVQALMQLALAPPEQRGQAMGVTMCGGLLVALFGGGFILVGVQTLTGTAKDTLGNGIGSIIFAALIGGLAAILLVVLVGTRAAGVQTGPGWVLVLAVVINGAAAVALLAAGILALAGREGYLRACGRGPRRPRYRR